MKRGSITIYLALTTMIMMSFITLIIANARENAQRQKAEISMDATLYSVFAEYNRALLSQYDLLFIDTSYGGKQGSATNLKEHLKSYMNRNLKETKNESRLFVRDLLALSATGVTLEKYSFATDEAGLLFERQAVDYVKTKYGINCMKKMRQLFDQARDQQFFTINIDKEQKQNQQQIDSVEKPKRKNKKDEWEEVALDNPADAVNGRRGIGLLKLLLPGEQEISKETVNLDNYVLNRTCKKGDGLLGRKGLSSAEKLLFDKYITEKTGCYTKVRDQALLQYELEYILFGKNSDESNLKETVTLLLLMRQAANYGYIMQDTAKLAEAEALAATLSAVVLKPELLELVKQSIIFAWVFAESVYDVRHLLSSGKIPLIKSAQTWHYSLEQMFSFQSDTTYQQCAEKEEGISYQEYLQLLLLSKGHSEKVARMMNLIEMNIRKTAGNKNFRLDLCVDYIEATIFLSSKYGRDLQITRNYYYF